MIYIILNGHNLKYDVYELVRVFFNRDDINFISNKVAIEQKSLIVESSLYKLNDKITVETKVFDSEGCISESGIIDIKNIRIKHYSVNRKVKIGIKQSVIYALLKINGKYLPWGILTGVRPVKIAHKLLDKDYNIKEVNDILTNQYLISKDRAELLTSVAKKDRKYIKNNYTNKFSLYVCIPFCPTRCAYCSFPSNSLIKKKALINTYVEKLVYEIRKIAEITRDRYVETVYIGGGTPTSISNNQLSKIIKEIYESFNTYYLKEFTVEAGRPDTIDEETLLTLKNNHVDRISINPQTMNDNTLIKIGRNHTSQDIIKAYEIAKKIGFKTINMDVIVGLPDESLEDVVNTMEKIAKLNPDNLTVHTLAVKKASKLKQSHYDISVYNHRLVNNMLLETKKYAIKRMNMYPYYLYRQKQMVGNYENVGYCKLNKECIYNIMIMEEKQTILAAGAGGVSKIYIPSEDRIERVPNVKGLEEYIERVDEMIDRKKSS